MFRRGKIRRFLEPQNFANPMIQREGGVPFYGNLYSGRVNSDDYSPKGGNMVSQYTRSLFEGKATNDDKDPILRAKLDKCPYFALCDMCVWQGMDEDFLDPGILTREEHHLMLLFSRAYYEKWKEIHAKPREMAPRMRIKHGRFALTTELLEALCVPESVIKKVVDALFDDSHLIALNPNCWATANLHPMLRDHVTGRTLDVCGLEQYQKLRLLAIINAMRTIVVTRKDREPEETVIIPFDKVSTLHDLYSGLGLVSYSGQIKLEDYIDPRGVTMTLTVNDEDSFFDFKTRSFFNPNIATYDEGTTSRYRLTVIEPSRRQQTQGFWF